MSRGSKASPITDSTPRHSARERLGAVGVDFIYREADYYLGEGADANRKVGNLVLGGSLTWSPKNDFGVFVAGDGSLYSFSLTSAKVDNLDKFLFDLKAGVKIKTGSIAAAR